MLPKGAKKLLDIGGSHGLHSIAFCQNNPTLNAVIFDLEESLQNTTAIIRENGLENRVTVQSGNAVMDSLGEGYDVVLYFSLIHNHSTENNQKIIHKIAKALNPGGMIVIHDYMGDDPLNDFHAAFNLTLFLEVGTGLSGFDHISEWLRSSGFQDVTRVDLDPLEKGTILTAIKP